LPPRNFDSPGRADFSALSTKVTFVFIQGDKGIFFGKGKTITNRNTLPALSKTPGRPEGELRLRRLPFRIMTPLATEGATFKKNGRADARAVVNGVFLDIKNNPGKHRIAFLSSALF
jgi:hypothetical protein